MKKVSSPEELVNNSFYLCENNSDWDICHAEEGKLIWVNECGKSRLDIEDYDAVYPIG